jgi:hypothetical protein
VPAGAECSSLIGLASPGASQRPLRRFRQITGARYRLLLTKVPPPPEPESAQLRGALSGQGIPLFAADIPRPKAFDRQQHRGFRGSGWAGRRSPGKTRLGSVPGSRGGVPCPWLRRASLRAPLNASGRARRALQPRTSKSPPQDQTGPSRASGKRSDPEWRSVTILMRKSVKKAARRRLEDEEQGRDLSTLIDELLTR